MQQINERGTKEKNVHMNKMKMMMTKNEKWVEEEQWAYVNMEKKKIEY